MAAAALISLYVYLNFRQGPNDLPADEVCLTFATVAIRSCAEASNAAAIDKQVQQLIEADLQQRGSDSAWRQEEGQQQQFGCAQVGGVDCSTHTACTASLPGDCAGCAGAESWPVQVLTAKVLQAWVPLHQLVCFHSLRRVHLSVYVCHRCTAGY